MLPVSITMLVTAMSASKLSRWPARSIVRVGLGLLAIAVVLLLSTIDPQIDDTWFAIAMAVLGAGLGLLASQLGNVVQSSVTDAERSEAGGLQFTAQQLGASLGTALIGAVLITGPRRSRPRSPRIRRSPPRSARRSESDSSPASASSSPIRWRPPRRRLLGEDEATGRRRWLRGCAAQALKLALLAAGFIVIASFAATRRLPAQRFDEMAAPEVPPAAGALHLQPGEQDDRDRPESEPTPAREQLLGAA